jgi:hypothetical protein
MLAGQQLALVRGLVEGGGHGRVGDGGMGGHVRDQIRWRGVGARHGGFDAGDVVDASAAVVGEAEDPLVEPEAAERGGALDVPQDQVEGALLAAFEAGLEPAGGGLGRRRVVGALLAHCWRTAGADPVRRREPDRSPLAA